MTILVCYDISSNSKRAAAARLLLSYGVRIQKSVYVCEVDAKSRDRLRVRLERIIHDEGDRFRIDVLHKRGKAEEPSHWVL